MTQFLVRKTHHTTGEVFFDVTRAKENEEFIVVDAENKEDAEEKVKRPKGLLEVVSSSFNNSLSICFIGRPPYVLPSLSPLPYSLRPLQ